MNIDYLHEFLVLAETGSFTEAAVRVSCSQPALSKHIASLERSVGAVLVDRSGAVKLTPIGKAFLEDARRVSFAWEQALSNVDRMRRETPMNLAVLTFRDYKPISDQIRLAVRNLRKDYPPPRSRRALRRPG